MKFEQRRFTVSPAVVPAGKPVTVTIKGHGEYYRFFDDIDYTVRVVPKEMRDYPIDDNLNILEVKYNTVKGTCKDGVLYFEYTFNGEQEWSVSVKAENLSHDPHVTWMHPIYNGNWNMQKFDGFKLNFRLYSLEDDLYQCKPYKGDTHTHTEFSDGNDTPEQFCAHYRGFGYDFMAVTDHYEYPACLRAIEKMSELKTNFTAFPGEEVHVKASGRFHMVNFNGKYSVNEIIENNYEEVKKQVQKLARDIDNLTESEAMEVAWTQWITEEIRKSGGISIYPHPYWTYMEIFNCGTHVSKEIFRRGFFDAYEAINGFHPQENNLQWNLYYEMRNEGIKIPIVGATDAHIGTDHGENCCAVNSTCVFAKSPEEIPDAIMDLRSTAVRHAPNEFPQVHGHFRYVRYTHFLLENYFPMHNELCKASGVLISEYFKGHKELKPAIELTENRIAEFEKAFFGR